MNRRKFIVSLVGVVAGATGFGWLFSKLGIKACSGLCSECEYMSLYCPTNGKWYKSLAEWEKDLSVSWDIETNTEPYVLEVYDCEN